MSGLAYLKDPNAIYARSFETILHEADLTGLPTSVRDVAMRMIHACGMPDIVEDLQFAADVADAGRDALAAGHPIIADCEAVSAAITRRLLPAGNKVVCTLNDPRTPGLAGDLATTRSAAAVSLWASELDGAVVVIGNAPTALFALLEALDNGASRPAAIIATPVGFVGAAESKEELARNPRGVPFLTLAGRRGGSERHRDLGKRMSAWLTIVGVGLEGVGGLPPSVRALLDTADIIVGRGQLLDGITAKSAEKHAWSSPIDDTLAQIESWNGRKVIVLATGDPMYFGVGATLTRRVPADDIVIIPAPSAFSLAAARLKWPLQGLETISLHGRPVSALHPFVQPGARLLALTAGNQTVHEVSNLLIGRGFGESILTVLENMGSGDERIVTISADECGQHGFADFNTLAIECIAGSDARFLPRVPGLPDDAFKNDGQLTKRDVRAITLSALGPSPQSLLWDVGAGCGSVAIEWMRAAPGAKAIAFERDENRIRMIAENAVALGAPDLDIVSGDVADSLGGHPTPSAVFLGGAVTNDDVFATCWNALAAGGRLVANTVTLEGDAALIARHEAHGGELIRIDVSHVGPVGARRAMRPRMSVLQWRMVKGQ